MDGVEESVADCSHAPSNVEGEYCARMHSSLAGRWHWMIRLNQVGNAATMHLGLQCRSHVSPGQSEMGEWEYHDASVDDGELVVQRAADF